MISAIRKITVWTPGWIVPPAHARTEHEAAMPSASSSGGIDSTTSITREKKVSTRPL